MAFRWEYQDCWAGNRRIILRTAEAMSAVVAGPTIIQARPSRLTRSETSRPWGVSMTVTAPGSITGVEAGLHTPDCSATIQACADLAGSAARVNAATWSLSNARALRKARRPSPSPVAANN